MDGARVQLTVAELGLIPASETSGGSGTSTPRMLISSGTGFHSVCHARCTNLQAHAHAVSSQPGPNRTRRRRDGMTGAGPTYQKTAPPVSSMLACLKTQRSMRAVVMVLSAEAYKDVASTRTRSGATAQQDAKRLPAATRLRAVVLDSVNHQAMTAEEMRTVVTSDGHEVHNIALR